MILAASACEFFAHFLQVLHKGHVVPHRRGERKRVQARRRNRASNVRATPGRAAGKGLVPKSKSMGLHKRLEVWCAMGKGLKTCVWQ